MKQDYYKLETRESYDDLRKAAKASQAIEGMANRKPAAIRFFAISWALAAAGAIIWELTNG